MLDSLQPPFQIFEAKGEHRPLHRRRPALMRDLPEVAYQIARYAWPDWTTLREVIVVEAATAAHARRGGRGGKLRPAGRAAPTDAAGVPKSGRSRPAPPPDGPVPPHWLRWHGELIRIGESRAQLPWQLLNFFWGRNSATFEELQGPGAPWPDPVSESAITTAVNRFNTTLPPDFPWRLATKAYCVVKKSRENPLV